MSLRVIKLRTIEKQSFGLKSSAANRTEKGYAMRIGRALFELESDLGGHSMEPKT